MLNQNQLLVIAPYWCDVTHTWVFDDDRVGLVREPFVMGIPEMINQIVGGIPNATSGFRLLFSKNEFPGALKLEKTREESDGAWYKCDALGGEEGWVCPAMYHYFERPAPNEIHVKAEPLSKGGPSTA